MTDTSVGNAEATTAPREIATTPSSRQYGRQVGLSVTKIFHFEAAHQLPNHDGKCRNLHGHSYTVEVTYEGPVNKDVSTSSYGMVRDFGYITQDFQSFFGTLDHSFLNERIENPTAENVAAYIIRQLHDLDVRHQSPYECVQVRVWETDDSYATAYIH